MLRTLLIAATIFTLPLFVKAQSSDQIDRTRLRSILVELGYEVKDLDKTPGKEKYECALSKDGLNIPVSYEMSASGNYIWLTVLLGKPGADSTTQGLSLLKQNAVIQPCFFYITAKGSLMMAITIENRGVTNAVFRRVTEFLTSRVSETKSYWQR